MVKATYEIGREGSTEGSIAAAHELPLSAELKSVAEGLRMTS